MNAEEQQAVVDGSLTIGLLWLDKLLRYFSPEIDWQLVAVNEDWRDEVKVVFRKRSS